ncbi:MAG: hypothetical protein V1701_12695 [Planctomycetota bacterium]
MTNNMRIIIWAVVILSASGYALAAGEKTVSPTATASVKAPPPKEQKDVFAGIKRGERITIVLNNRNTFTGEIKYVIKDKIELDITFDSPTLMGTMAFKRKDINEIRKLDALDESVKTEIKDKKKTEAKKNKAEAANKKDSNTASVPEQQESGSQDESKLLALLDKFPPGKVWNKARYDEIQAIALYLQTPEEKEFLVSYEDWNKAQSIQEELNRKHILEKFPPGVDWNEARFKELSTKFTRLGISLTEIEQEFIDKYPDWIKAKIEAEEEQKKNE